ITFGNPTRTEPIVDVSATADVKGYTVNAQVVGTLGARSRLQFNLSSDPPLSNEQIANLLLTGTAPETAGTRTADSTTASSIAGSLAGLAFRPVTSQVQQLFRLDRFQVDPVLQSAPGSSGGAVITIGKNLSKDLSVTYSYSAETNAQSVILVEYQLDANKLIQASKDENNVFSVGVKFRKRF
ncbi:MAG TPA: translocation/assembly module TamB domain-containing protein, partial [Thermoanaerobaculia bacterium]|nr:translocation/assembly module TamB domain-containing protein [Thermoanaerobaculia bacterium]